MAVILGGQVVELLVGRSGRTSGLLSISLGRRGSGLSLGGGLGSHLHGAVSGQEQEQEQGQELEQEQEQEHGRTASKQEVPLTCSALLAFS